MNSLNSWVVDWIRSAKRELLAVWLKAPDQAEITRTANVIERLLMLDPHACGQPLRRGYRSLFVTPLTVKYQIDDQRKTVAIVTVRFGNKTP